MLIARAVFALLAGTAIGGDARTVCDNATWTDHGIFYSFWHDAGSGCMRVGGDGTYQALWQLGANGNLVAGEGWQRGSTRRVVHYTARDFRPGRNGYLSLYGWSTRPLVEYYVVQDWGGFVPPGPTAAFLGKIVSDGGTYRVYRTQRVDQPSIVGKASFVQYWSVRTMPGPIGTPVTITFANHVAGWRRLGLPLGRLDYQIVATEGFGSTGQSDIALADR